MGQEDELKKVTGRELLSKYGSDEPPEHRGHPVKMVTFEEQLLVDAGWGGGGDGCVEMVVQQSEVTSPRESDVLAQLQFGNHHCSPKK